MNLNLQNKQKDLKWQALCEFLLNLMMSNVGPLKSMDVEKSHDQENREHGDNFRDEQNREVYEVGRPDTRLLKQSTL